MDGFVLVSLAFFLVEVYRKLLTRPAKFPVEVSIFDSSYRAAACSRSGSLALHRLKVDVAKGHPTKVSGIGDARVGAGERGEKGNATNDHHEVFRLQRKQHVHVQNAIWKREAIGEQNPVNRARGTDRRSQIVRRNEKNAETCSNACQAIVLKEAPAAPIALQFTAKHEQRKHVEQQVEESSPVMQKHVGEELPEVELMNNQRRDEAEVTRDRVARQQLNDVHCHTSDDDVSHHRRQRTTK